MPRATRATRRTVLKWTAVLEAKALLGLALDGTVNPAAVLALPRKTNQRSLCAEALAVLHQLLLLLLPKLD